MFNMCAHFCVCVYVYLGVFMHLYQRVYVCVSVHAFCSYMYNMVFFYAHSERNNYIGALTKISRD